MTEEVACAECGALVSANTARRMKGLCLNCKMKRSRADPFRMLYQILVDRVRSSPGGHQTLSEPERLYHGVGRLRAEVNNGGFHQFFYNSSGSYYADAEDGLLALGATKTLEILREAKTLLFPTLSVPLDTEKRRQVILIVSDPYAIRPEWAIKLDELDKKFYADSEDLLSRMKAFALDRDLVRERQDADR